MTALESARREKRKRKVDNEFFASRYIERPSPTLSMRLVGADARSAKSASQPFEELAK